jgi:hypothetical protein
VYKPRHQPPHAIHPHDHMRCTHLQPLLLPRLDLLAQLGVGPQLHSHSVRVVKQVAADKGAWRGAEKREGVLKTREIRKNECVMTGTWCTVQARLSIPVPLHQFATCSGTSKPLRTDVHTYTRRDPISSLTPHTLNDHPNEGLTPRSKLEENPKKWKLEHFLISLYQARPRATT